MEKYRILTVEDEGIVAKDIEGILVDLGYDVVGIASTGEKAIEIALDKKPDLILMDITIKGPIDGTETAKIIRSKAKIPIIFLTAYSDENTIQKAKQTEPFGYLIKPFHSRDLYTTIEMAMYKRKIELRLEELSEERLKLLESEKTLREEAEKANKAKDYFLAMVSHELRSPLSSIVGWAQVIKKNLHSLEKVSQGISVIEKNAHAQEVLINDLIDSAQIITGKLSFDFEPVEIGQILKTVIDNLNPLCSEKKIKLLHEFHHKNDQVEGDFSRILQVFTNVVANAKKFTPENGTVKITTQNSVDMSSIHVSIKDTGIGIDSEFIPYIFDRFTQDKNHQGNNSSKLGLGLGMSIAKHIVESHKGKISVHSEGINKGATFSITLPLIHL